MDKAALDGVFFTFLLHIAIDNEKKRLYLMDGDILKLFWTKQSKSVHLWFWEFCFVYTDMVASSRMELGKASQIFSSNYLIHHPYTFVC